MVTSMLCIACRPPSDDALSKAIGLDKLEPNHCYGTGDHPAPPGVLGGTRCPCPCRDLPRPEKPDA